MATATTLVFMANLRNGLNDVARALSKEGYGDLWAMLLDVRKLVGRAQ